MARIGEARKEQLRPIVAGAGVGLLTGTVGLLFTLILLDWNPLGGLIGAVGCGITVAYVSEERPTTTVLYAATADVVSSVLFFLLVLVAYLTSVAISDGVISGLLASTFFSLWYFALGIPVAIIAGSISVCLTAITATVATAVIRHQPGTAASP